MSPALLEVVVLALARGSAYALIAFGFAVVFGVGRVLNLFHGSFFLLGAYGVYWLSAALALPAEPGVVALAALASAVLVGGLGWLQFRLLILPLVDHPARLLAVGLAANLLVEAALRAATGTRGIPVAPIFAGTLALGAARIPRQEMAVAGAAVLLFIAAWLFLTRTRAGSALRAVAQDRRGAELVGIRPAFTLGIAVAGAALFAALAGALTAPLRVVHPALWSFALLKSLTVVIVGGIGRLGGAIVAAYAIGAVEVAVTYAAGEAMADVVAMSLAIAALLLRPRGLFGAS